MCHYNPRFVHFLPTFWSWKTFFQEAFFLKFWSYGCFFLTLILISLSGKTQLHFHNNESTCCIHIRTETSWHLFFALLNWFLGWLGRVTNIIYFSGRNWIPMLISFRPVVPGCAGCVMVHPDFGRSVNPISTRGNRLCPPNYYWHTQIFRPSNDPA